MTGRAALALTLASLIASALNYFYQVHAAAVLDATAFGLLSTWLARVTLIGTIATVVQFVSLESPLPIERFDGLLRIAGAVAAAVLALHVVFGASMSPVLLGVTAIGSGVVLYAVLGQLYARLQLGVVGVSVLAAATLRFAVPFAWAKEVRAPAFYLSHATAALLGIVAAAAVVTLGRRPVAPPEKVANEVHRVRLGRPILLAFATVLFPLIDVLVVSSTQDARVTGVFSRIHLASRIVFFAGAAALQILLPHQLRATAAGERLPVFAARIERWLTASIASGAIVLATLLDQLLLHTEGPHRIWLYGSCFASALLVAILGNVNKLAARERLGAASALVAGVVVTSAASAGLAAFQGEAAVTRYTVGVVIGAALVLLVARAARMRSRDR